MLNWLFFWILLIRIGFVRWWFGSIMVVLLVRFGNFWLYIVECIVLMLVVFVLVIVFIYMLKLM